MNKILTFIFAILFAMPCFATGVSGNSGTCDSGALGTDGGSTILRANYEPETIHLRWYDENNNLLTVNSASQSCTYGDSITIPTAPTKTGYRFTGWSVFSDYTPIEYIESTGTQYIDTGFLFTGDTMTLELIYKIENVDNVWRNLFGLADAYPQERVLGLQYTDNYPVFGVSIGAGTPVWSTDTIGTVHTLSLTVNRNDNTYQFINNENEYSGTFEGTISNTVSMILFNIKYGNNMGGNEGKYKNYGFKITQDGVLVRDFIPVKDIHDVACMYDKISGQFFYNQGTGNFIAGPDL